MYNQSPSASTANNALVGQAFTEYHDDVCRYINSRIHHREDACDMTQDVFLRLMNYQDMLRVETLRNFVFTLARNLVIDYLRHRFYVQEAAGMLQQSLPREQSTTQMDVEARDLARLERSVVRQLSDMRRKVYVMNRFQGRTTTEIAQTFQLKKATIDNHLYIARQQVRDYVTHCI